MNDEQALEAVARAVRDVASDPIPEVNWENVERQALRRLHDATPVTVASTTWRTWAAFGAAAVALVAIALPVLAPSGANVAHSTQSGSSAVPVADADRVADVEGHALSPGDVVEAKGQATRVTHVGHSSWTLGPKSSARVSSLGSIVELELLSGSLSAEVEPTAASRSFVVRVGGATVSVRGTKFRLDLKDDVLTVDVTDGVVAVRGSGEARERVLRAPAKGTFPAHVTVPTLAPRATAPPPAQAPSANTRRLPPAGNVANVAVPDTTARDDTARDAASQQDATMTKIVAGLRQCYADPLAGRGDTRVAVRTRLTLTLDATGVVTGTRFDPPLAPSVLPCARAAISSARFPASGAPARMERDLVFGSTDD